ncbi:putative membrane protein required for colicin V production [Microbacterium terrae]|uniref:Serine protease n=1 Tax=Microbacterium terrae TaxID=69369 RepID=A0A0M2H7T3_9MICO|nr:MarP family serine protease [Microbacterium terrae]KJL40009.1 Serine protease [Microbacterium terrae]MBP1076949.1 putative membrane protein required for colicin V production [Microbacterium terrae]GLJ99543.1 serine protease [Microbacterium terrae]
MIVVDVILIALLILALAAGGSRGFVGSLGLIVGLVLGGAAAFWLIPIVNDALPLPEWRPIVVLIGILVLLIGGASLGAAVGDALRRGVERTPLRVVDRILGAVVGVVAAALSMALVGASLATVGMPVISSAIASSRVLGAIDALTPEPVDRALAEVRGVVLDAGLPALGDLLGTAETPVLATVDLDDPELAAAAASVARVSGTAYACGTSSTGSGFVIAADRIVTNAHVVAGVDAPVVELPGLEAREGRIVYFDPIDDLAVIAVDRLGAGALDLAPTAAAGTPAAVQGYPLGGPFTMVPAGVVSVGSASVPDIYDSSMAFREIYALQAEIRPGNSGGPLLTGDGEVIGLVFARSEDDPERGYAMTMAELDPVIDQAAGLRTAVSTGDCTG